MQKVINALSSFILTGVLLFIFAAASGVATFIENDYGAASAKVIVYNAIWFQGVMLLLAINLSLILFKTKAYKKPSVFILHASFLVILLGAALTHFFGFEGVMHIRNGQTSNTIVSADTFISISDGNETAFIPANFSPIYAGSLNKSVRLGENAVKISLKEYVPNAVRVVEEDKNGSGVVSLMIANESDKPEQYALGEQDAISSFGLTFGFAQNADVRFVSENGKMYVIADKKLKITNLADDSAVEVAPKEPIELLKGKLYSIGNVRFVPKAAFANGRIRIVSQGIRGGENAVILNVSVEDATKEAVLFGQNGEIGSSVGIEIGGKIYKLAFGSKLISLPFSITLDKFELLRYPGSMSPSSFSSFVKVNAPVGAFEYHIYMNHVLDYDGYRFFQSSYDLDEQGTILSVSKDPGKIPTYLGYAMLCIGVFLSFFNPRGRLWALGRKLTPAVVLLAFFASSPNSYANDTNASAQIDAIFGTILVQDSGGRIKPMQSLAIDIVDKIAGSSSIDGHNASGIILSMITYPKEWERQQIIKVTHPKLKEILGMQDGQKRAAFSDAFNKDMQYKLANFVEEANRKPQSRRDTFDKDVLKVDERFNVCMMVFTGQFLRIFPKPNDANNTWLDPQNALAVTPKDYAERAFNVLQDLFGGVEAANLPSVEKAYVDLLKLQEEYGANVMPTKQHVDAEIFYNSANIFGKLIYVYILLGLVLFVAQIAINEKSNDMLKKVSSGIFLLMCAAFIVQTFGLGLRWYISGHAPWSDGYESMIYIAWASMLAGLIFYRFLPLALAMTGLLSAAMLMTAHIGFVDPQITNVVPVLKSYWLNIHVSLITASYGFLGLGFFLGLLTLGFFMFKDASKPNRDEMIKKIAIVNEMTLIVGLGLLVIGNFLGGVWANESWGRYWGWDPKETWALVSILVYTIIVHYRFIPGLKSVFAFSALSVFGFGSILMTYFGVNYYLSGLHSYASGDPIPVPWFVWLGFVLILALFAASYQKRNA